MATINFNKTMFKLDSENMIIITKSLKNLVRESAEKTTSPRGVEPKLHIEERDGMYQLRMWGPYGQGNTLVDEYETEEEAQTEWMNRTYEDDFVNSDEYCNWFETEDEAISNYLEYAIREIDDTLTSKKIRKQIATKRAEIEEYKTTTGSRLNRQMKEQYDFCKANGTVTKNARKLARTILWDGTHYDGNWEMYINYRDLVSADTIALATEIDNTPKA